MTDSTSNPAVSVVLPVYNCGRFLVDAVQSILDQTFRDFELIVINDGSTDDSLSILQKFAANDSRVRLVDQPNAGLVRSLNRGLEMARAPLIARMDGDDISLPHRFERQVKRLQDDPGVVCVSGFQYIIDVAGRILRLVEAPTNDKELQELMLTGHSGLCHPASMFRKEAAMRVGAYRAEMWPAEDLDLWLRMGEIGKLANVPEVVLKYRVRPDSISEMDGVKQREKARLACTETWARRGIKGSFTADEPWRAGKSRLRQYSHLCSYGWSAYYLREWRTAFIYAMKAIMKAPYKLEAWKLAVLAAKNRANVTPPAHVSAGVLGMLFL